ncbi:MAG: hypothetical protein ACERKZ_18325 [Lachnotalea sp.]
MLLAAIFGIVGLIFIINGISDRFCKKPVGIYHNLRTPSSDQISDVKAYNKAVGNLYLLYALYFIFNGIILFIDPVKTTIIVVTATFPLALGIMFYYELKIVPKYFI